MDVSQNGNSQGLKDSLETENRKTGHYSRLIKTFHHFDNLIDSLGECYILRNGSAKLYHRQPSLGIWELLRWKEKGRMRCDVICG